MLVVVGGPRQALLHALTKPPTGLAQFHPTELLAAGTDEVHRAGVEQILALRGLRIHQTYQPATDAFLDRANPSVTGQGCAQLSRWSSGN